MTTVIGLLFIGAVLGAGVSAIYYQNQREVVAVLRQALRQANAETAAANLLVQQQANRLDVQQRILNDTRSDLESLVNQRWPLPATTEESSDEI